MSAADGNDEDGWNEVIAASPSHRRNQRERLPDHRNADGRISAISFALLTIFVSAVVCSESQSRIPRRKILC
jgi:hypothetical protein